MRPNTLRDTSRGILIGVAIVVFMVIGVLLASPSKADGILTAQEQAFGDAVADTLCEYIDQAGVNQRSMSSAMKTIYEHTPNSMDLSDAVDIINYSVGTYCPGHWSELVAFGEGARS